ncbi:MAG: BBP7 family outer membrane beta-barrel protein [Planctomycetota bacterium]
MLGGRGSAGLGDQTGEYTSAGDLGDSCFAGSDRSGVVRINGSTVFTSSTGTSVTQNGGLLALPTNIGSYSRDQFSVVPEVGLNVGRQLTDNVRVYVGYTLIYWSSVVRPGDQIDPVINPTQLPTPTGPGTLVGPARPAFAFHDTDFWAQGINFGLEFRR